jgi:hypothetical protein
MLRINRLYYSFMRSFRNAILTPKWCYQRIRYGFSDRDWWNGDFYLAGVIAGIMEDIVNKGHGVATSYAYGDWETPIEAMVESRDAEFNKYIAIFREYSKNGPAIDQEWVDNFGGVLDKDMQDALQWLSQHFQELWD